MYNYFNLLLLLYVMVLFRRKGKGDQGEGRGRDREEEDVKSQHKDRSYLEVNLEGLMAVLDRLDMEGSGSSKSIDNTSNVREAIKIARRFNQHIDALKGVSEGLRRRVVRDELTLQLKGIVERARDTITNVIVEVSKPLPEPEGVNDIALISDKAKRMLNRIGDALGSHRRILYEFFPAEARALKDILIAMKRDVDVLDSIAKSIDEHASSHSRCRDRIVRLMQMEQEINAFNAKMKEMREELDTLEQERVEVKEMREAILKTSEYIELERIISNARIEYDRLLADVARDFSRLSRAISKYAYEIGFEKEKYEMLKAVMDEPARLKDVNTDVIRDVLGRVSDGIASGRLHLKNPEKDIENVYSLMDRLEYYINKCKEYEGIMSIYSGRIMPYKDRLKIIDGDLERVEREMGRVRGMLEEYSKRVDSLKSAINVEVQQLTDEIYRIYGLNVRITCLKHSNTP
jgi:chromosome segregation ATPase